MVNHGTVATNRHEQRMLLTRTLWQWFSSKTILAAIGIIVFILLLCALLIRQMPGPIADDPAAASRWVLSVSEEYGVLGGPLRALGLFDVVHNPLLQLLLAVIALSVFIHLGNMVTALWRFWQIAQTVPTPVDTVGTPLPLSSRQPLYRLREAIPQEPQTLYTHLSHMLKAHFQDMSTDKVAIADQPLVSIKDEQESQAATAAESTLLLPTRVEEWQLLNIRDRRVWIWLRPLFLLGLLLALSGIWLILVAGWEVMPPLLAPGEQYRATTQRVTLTYKVVENFDALVPTLATEMDDQVNQVPIGTRQRLTFGQVTLQADPGPPALWLRSTDAAVTLSRPGQTQNSDNLGLIFPSLGSEESVVVSSQIGLRIVRVAVLPEGIKVDEEGATGTGQTLSWTNSSMVSPIDTMPQEQFLVEVYQSDATKPVQTLVINGPAIARIQISGKIQELTIVPLPSMAATVRYQPGIWLLWVALALGVLGLVGFWYQPAFLLIQLAPWPTARTVVVAQSDVAAEIEQLRLYLRSN